MQMSTLIVGLLAGALGAGYFVYGKRQAKITPMVAGALLCIYPYFVDGALWLVLIGVALAAAPFVLDYFLP
jgi:hypothetical protein